MSHDALVRALAERAGLSVDWTDQSGRPQTVAPDALRGLLAVMGLACDTETDARFALARLDERDRERPLLVTVRVGEAFTLAFASAGPAKLTRQDGATFDFPLEPAPGGASVRPILEPGYHRLDYADGSVTVAVAPRQGYAITYVARERRMWGLAAQVYGLTREGDGGIGDFGGVAALAEAAAAAGADALALSPTHAVFTADPTHFGPYSPSSRLFLNPLNADPDFVFGEARVAECVRAARQGAARREQETAALIDWPQAAAAKLATLRALYDSFRSIELADPRERLAQDFARFRAEGGGLLEDHARFEALHGSRLRLDRGQWDWRSWPEALRDPRSHEVAAFAEANETEVEFHLFLQWVADRSLAAAQAVARQAGMAIGLVSDLAVGMAAGGSHAWSRRDDVLVGLSVGAPPDLFNANGQAWGLATFSPMALKRRAFEPFLATLRAAMRHAGGVRIDHVMGLQRLWVSPEGADPKDGAYLAFPLDDMLRLVALESYLNEAVVFGEDLGTVPEGFRERLAETGIAGMRVLQFERDGDGGFLPPQAYAADALAMTTTHDLPTTAGWWSGADIELRASIAGAEAEDATEQDRAARGRDREALWRAFEAAGAADGELPEAKETGPAVDAAIRFLAGTPSRLVLLPLEDALGQVEQPNLPGTLDEHPNWRRRLKRPAPELLAEPQPKARLASLDRRRIE